MGGVKFFDWGGGGGGGGGALGGLKPGSSFLQQSRPANPEKSRCRKTFDWHKKGRVGWPARKGTRKKM